MITPEIVNDPELLDEFIRAYHIAAPYRERVQFRKDFLTSRYVEFEPDGRRVLDYTSLEILIDAERNYISAELQAVRA